MKIRIIIGAGQIGFHGGGITMVTTITNAKKMFGVTDQTFRVGDPASAAVYYFLQDYYDHRCRGRLANFYETTVQIDIIK